VCQPGIVAVERIESGRKENYAGSESMSRSI